MLRSFVWLFVCLCVYIVVQIIETLTSHLMHTACFCNNHRQVTLETYILSNSYLLTSSGTLKTKSLESQIIVKLLEQEYRSA
jgi:hypothetical protein